MDDHHRLEGRLFLLAALFVLAYAAALTLAPRVRAHEAQAPLRLVHWIGFLGWLVSGLVMLRARRRFLPQSSPLLLPLALLLTGWGLLTIWRLTPPLGLRQTVWLGLAAFLFALGSRYPLAESLQRYKYLWLFSGLLLTALTLLLGSNPLGYGPRLWLRVGGVYFQPSEPLKLLLAIYMSAYLGGLPGLRRSLWPYILPTLALILAAVGLLASQRDLGTASLLVMIYTAALYLSSGRRRVLVIGGGLLLGLGALGYAFSDLVRLRLSIWYNPWSDPQGSGYQIIQALMALANGGLPGRGPGLGYPGLVPVSYSDFIYPALVEESGLAGALGLLGLWALLVGAGFRLALRAENAYQRLLAATLSLYLGGQALVIMGGSSRLLPLTGVTLPFMSYGGSSLLTAFAALLLLLQVSQRARRLPLTAEQTRPYRHLHNALLAGLALLALATGWWTIVRSGDLLARSDNPRRALNARFSPRGALLDRNGRPINQTEGQAGGYVRRYAYPDLLPIVGYTHPVYGETGLEAALDDYLRGERGRPAREIWQYHLLYGQPPPGLDVRLTLDADLSQQAADLLAGRAGAVVLLEAASGQILALASQPSYHPEALEDLASLVSTEEAPLLNRATQGLYPLPPGLLAPFRAAGWPADWQRPADAFRLPLSAPRNGLDNPLLLALDAAALTNGGLRPAPEIVFSVRTPQGDALLQPPGTPQTIPLARPQALTAYQLPGTAFWAHSAANETLTWAVGGTLPEWPGQPLTAVVVLESRAPNESLLIVRRLLQAATR